MKTGIGQSKYRNLTLFHVVWSVPAKVFLTVTFAISLQSMWFFSAFVILLPLCLLLHHHHHHHHHHFKILKRAKTPLWKFEFNIHTVFSVTSKAIIAQVIIIKMCFLMLSVAVHGVTWNMLGFSYKEDITRWREDMNFIFEFLPRENKIQIFKPPCKVLFII